MAPEDLELEELDPAGETAPFLASGPEAGVEKDHGAGGRLPLWPFACLLLGHLSCTFNCAAFSLAQSLYLIEVFGDTMVPASLVGLFKTIVGMLLSSFIGGLVDTTPRYKFMRIVIGSEKILHGFNHLIFCLSFNAMSKMGHLSLGSGTGTGGGGSLGNILASWGVLLANVLFAGVLSLVMTGMTVSIQRDWVTVIAEGNEGELTRLNTYLRRIDLLGGIAAPFVVSTLTTRLGYPTGFFILSSLAIVSFILEFWWIKVVYTSVPALASKTKSSSKYDSEEGDPGRRSWSGWYGVEKALWREFLHHPIFLSSLALAITGMSTINGDGPYLTYVKSIRGWNNDAVALLKVLCEVAGLGGTLLMPLLENAMGLESTGTVSILSLFALGIPVVVSMFVATGSGSGSGVWTWSSGILLFGTALSRTALWSFDLCQLKLLQISISSHPSRNRLAALQLSLQSSFNLLRYLLTLVVSKAEDFKWTGTVSVLAVGSAGASWVIYHYHYHYQTRRRG